MKNTALLLADIAGILLKYGVSIKDYSLEEHSFDNNIVIKIEGELNNEK